VATTRSGSKRFSFDVQPATDSSSAATGSIAVERGDLRSMLADGDAAGVADAMIDDAAR
jgi:hypothetical protein